MTTQEIITFLQGWRASNGIMASDGTATTSLMNAQVGQLLQELNNKR